MSDDTPTQRFDAPLTPSTPPETPTPGDDATRRARGLLIALIAVGSVLVITLVVVIVLLLGNRTTVEVLGTDSPSPTPTESASPTPTSAAPTPTASATIPSTGTAPKPSSAPTANGAPVFTRFDIPDARCTGSTGTSPVTITYASVGASNAYFGVGVANAKEAPTEGPLPASGSLTFDYQCSNATQIWIITLVDGAGGTTNKSREVHSGAN